jgi:protein farnesyltransferase/geranylgeranyltransferase type-1 subunit alpha
MSDIEEDEFHVFYRDREDWKDVIPLEQDDGPDPVVAIDYSDKFRDVFDYFRAIVASGEKSKRALALTADALKLNAANYTVWQYRRDVLVALNIPCRIGRNGVSKEFALEFQFCQEMVDQNQKNYQVWHHRKSIVAWAAGLNDDKCGESLSLTDDLATLQLQELNLTERLLSIDAKNYHVWQHRQWIISLFGTFSQELGFVDFLIQDDVRNNSAWNQRYFVVSNWNEEETKEDLLNREIDYTWDKILLAPSNESPWSYLQGLFLLTSEVTLSSHDSLYERCVGLYKSGSNSVPMLGFLIDLYDARLKVRKDTKESYYEAVKICNTLADSLDQIRKPYWSTVRDKLITWFDKMDVVSDIERLGEIKDFVSLSLFS